MTQRVWLFWSSGKDSAWALHVLRADSRVRVEALVTTFTRDFDRVSVHAVRRELVEAQARAAGLPLRRMEIPYPSPNAVYEEAFRTCLDDARRAGVDGLAFGDLHLEEVRAYRERLLAGTGVEPVFPLWGRDTRALAETMVAGGLVAWITCLDPRVLPEGLAGARFDADLLAQLPAGVDPCGERGEFHTFACAGPMFRHPIAVRPGARVHRDGFVFADLRPAEEAAPPPGESA